MADHREIAGSRTRRDADKPATQRPLGRLPRPPPGKPQVVADDATARELAGWRLAALED